MPAFLEIFTAWYDGREDTIKGYKEGGVVWLHEARHQEQFNNPAFRKIYCGAFFFFQTLGLICLYLTLTDKIGFYGIGLLATPFLIVVILSEIDAWAMALYRRYK